MMDDKPVQSTLDGPVAGPEAAPARKKVQLAKPVTEAAVEVATSGGIAPAGAPAGNLTQRIEEIGMAEVLTMEKVAPAFEAAATEAVDRAKAGFAEAQTKWQAVMEKQMKSMTEVTEFTKGNIEALIDSAKAATAGAETITSHFVETGKTAFEEAQAAFKTLAASKTPNEFIQQQNELAKAQFDKAVANWSKATETWMKVAGEVVQPISNRMALAAETVKKSVA